MDQRDELAIAVTEDDATRRVTVEGDLHSLTCGELKSALEPLLADGANLEVDLSRVPFMDSSGLSCLLVARQSAIKHNGTFVVTRLSPRVEQVLETTGTLPLLTASGPDTSGGAATPSSPPRSA